MPTLDLGFEVPDYSGAEPVSPSKTQKTKTAYPTMTISGKKGLARSLTPGQEITCTVKFRVVETVERQTSDESRNYYDGPHDGTRVELEAKSIIFDKMKIDGGEEEKDGASAIKEYFGKNKKAPSDEGDAFGGGDGE